jgi:predicted HTH domain antitoxin
MDPGRGSSMKSGLWKTPLLLVGFWVLASALLIISYVLLIPNRDLAGLVAVASLVAGTGLLLLGLYLGRQEERMKVYALERLPSAERLETGDIDAVKELLQAAAELIEKLGKLSLARFALIAGMVLFLSASFLGWRSVPAVVAGDPPQATERERQQQAPERTRDRTERGATTTSP